MPDLLLAVFPLALGLLLASDLAWTSYAAGRVLRDPRAPLLVVCEQQGRRTRTTTLRDGADLVFPASRGQAAVRVRASAFAPDADGGWGADLVDADGDRHRLVLRVRGQRAGAALRAQLSGASDPADDQHVRRAAVAPHVHLAVVSALALGLAVLVALTAVAGGRVTTVDGLVVTAVGAIGLVGAVAAVAGLRGAARPTSDRPEVRLSAAPYGG